MKRSPDEFVKRWLVLTVEAPSEAQRDALVEGLLALGGSAVQENGPQLTTYIAAPPATDAFIAEAQATLRGLIAVEPRLTWLLQDDADWSQNWKRGLRPKRVGRHFIVAPSWTTPERRTGDHVIIIDPEMAFGTGEHATTRGALRFLEEVTTPGDRVLDVGTGSAILAIGAAMLGATSVLGVDNDADAI
ncbi:MAG TPA: 50S ribosomal protein L11 methyltransferase, partial [Longimicrobiales bacterium]